ncbi:class I SAM-dependent methyltransferase [Nonomuraea typhae]|uniref:S-adenosyl-L-methionine-dependent methyltransferase n=1 Tax=Nonomuraea typhae TaxID=2603600 RepID=A0ABW7Z7F7_9ACTN
MSGEVRAGSVKLTSDWMAVIRAREHVRPDAYLSDPCAAVFVTPASEAELDRVEAEGLPSQVVPIRGRLGDQTLLQSGVRQAVCLGSGTDTRAWRLPLGPAFTYYEVDLPGQLTGKREMLAAAGFPAGCDVRQAEADLRGDWTPALLDAGFSPAEPVHWIAEGLFYYLTRPEADTLLRAVTALSAPGSWLTFDGPDDGFLHDPAREGFLRGMRQRGAPFVGSFGDPVTWLAPYGWTGRAVLHRDLAAHPCPWLPAVPPHLLTPAQDVWFVQARRDQLTASPGAASGPA